MVSAIALLGGCRQPRMEMKADSGRAIYMARCALCHGENGEGRPGLYPPVAGTEWVNGPPERLAAIILDGMQGPMGNYNAVMPGWRGVLHDTEIAAVMTWLRQAEGKAPVTAVEINHVHVETEGRNTFLDRNRFEELANALGGPHRSHASHRSHPPRNWIAPLGRLV